MSEHGRREVRWIVAASLVVAGLGVASSVSSALETVLNLWVGLPIAVVSVGALVVLGVRAAWSTLLIEWELHRPIQADELATHETEEV